MSYKMEPSLDKNLVSLDKNKSNDNTNSESITESITESIPESITESIIDNDNSSFSTSNELSSILKKPNKYYNHNPSWAYSSTSVCDLESTTEGSNILKDDICKILKIIKCLNKEIKCLKRDKIDYNQVEDLYQKTTNECNNQNDGGKDGCKDGGKDCDKDGGKKNKYCPKDCECGGCSYYTNCGSEKSTSSHHHYDLDDKIKNYINHQINYKSDEILSILDERLISMETTIENIKKLALPNRYQ